MTCHIMCYVPPGRAVQPCPWGVRGCPERSDWRAVLHLCQDHPALTPDNDEQATSLSVSFRSTCMPYSLSNICICTVCMYVAYATMQRSPFPPISLSHTAPSPSPHSSDLHPPPPPAAPPPPPISPFIPPPPSLPESSLLLPQPSADLPLILHSGSHPT